MRMLAVENALKIFEKYKVLHNTKTALDVGGARKVWLETDTPENLKLIRQIHYRVLKFLRANVRPPKGLITTDNPLISAIPGLRLLEMGFNSRTLDTGTDITGDFLDDNLIESLRDSFDLVLCFDTLEHVSNPWKFCQNLVNVTRSGGYIYVATVFSWGFHPAPHDFYRFSPDGLRECFHGSSAEIVEAGWDEYNVSVFALLRRLQ
jgi:SAM-dependent methyltransferase